MASSGSHSAQISRDAASPIASVSSSISAAPDIAAAEPNKPILFGRGVWTYFSDPRAARNETTTFVGWITGGGWVRVASYDWATKRITVKRLGPAIGPDDHNNPAIVIRPDGRLVVFYSPHSGRNLPVGRKSQMYYRISRAKGDVRAWGRAHRVSSNSAGGLGFTYPSPIALSNGNIWMAWRGGNWLPTRSVLSGQSGKWKKAKNLVRRSSGAIRSRPERPYAKYAAGKDGRIHMAYTNAHPYGTATNIYYVSIDPKTDRLFKAGGKRIGRAPVQVKTGERVYSYKTAGHGWVMGVADDGTGKPVIVLSTGWSAKKKARPSLRTLDRQ